MLCCLFLFCFLSGNMTAYIHIPMTNKCKQSFTLHNLEMCPAKWSHLLTQITQHTNHNVTHVPHTHSHTHTRAGSHLKPIIISSTSAQARESKCACRCNFRVWVECVWTVFPTSLLPVPLIYALKCFSFSREGRVEFC